MVSRLPQMVPGRSMIASRCSKRAPRWPKIIPKMHQDGPNLCKLAPELLNMIPSLPQYDSTWHFMCNCTNERRVILDIPPFLVLAIIPAACHLSPLSFTFRFGNIRGPISLRELRLLGDYLFCNFQVPQGIVALEH